MIFTGDDKRKLVGTSTKEEPMRDKFVKTSVSSRETGYPLPATLEEAEELAASIEQAVRSKTGRGIRNLRVEVDRNGVRLNGYCNTYYCKQLAQHAAMAHPGGQQLTNAIEVS